MAETGKPIKVIKLKNGAIRRIYAHDPKPTALGKAVRRHLANVLSYGSKNTKKSAKRNYVRIVLGGAMGKKK